uniref:Uncharacterized protein n=1 Tax=Oryza barthii TaxID=65489 RepID=A0A0D3HT66_9ORYZ
METSQKSSLPSLPKASSFDNIMHKVSRTTKHPLVEQKPSERSLQQGNNIKNAVNARSKRNPVFT